MPSKIEFRSLRCADLKFGFAFVGRETVPQIHRKFGSFAGRQLQ